MSTFDTAAAANATANAHAQQRPSRHVRALRRQQRVDGPVPQVQAVRQHTDEGERRPTDRTATPRRVGRAAHSATSSADNSEWTKSPPWNNHRDDGPSTRNHDSADDDGDHRHDRRERASRVG